MNKLVDYLKLTPEELKFKLFFELKKKDMSPIFKDGYLYAKGEMPILLVAHMDTVFAPPKRVMNKQGVLYNPNGGLGGDDRCGIYAIMTLLEKYRPHVLFTEDEEIGCIGAYKAAKTLDAPDVKYIIEFDRKGRDDCVFYECGNEEFMEYIQSFGFKMNYGSCSDISELGPAWDIAAVNLSSGYYNEHTYKEYIIFSQLTKTIKRAEKMLKQLEKAPYFDYQEIKYEPLNRGGKWFQYDIPKGNESDAKQMILYKKWGIWYHNDTAKEKGNESNAKQMSDAKQMNLYKRRGKK